MMMSSSQTGAWWFDDDWVMMSSEQTGAWWFDDDWVMMSTDQAGAWWFGDDWVMMSYDFNIFQKYHGSNIIYVFFLHSTNNIYKWLIYLTIETYLRVHLTYQNKENLWIHLPSHPPSAILWCHQFWCDIIRVKTARYELNKKA